MFDPHTFPSFQATSCLTPDSSAMIPTRFDVSGSDAKERHAVPGLPSRIFSGNSIGVFRPQKWPQYWPENQPEVPFEKDTCMHKFSIFDVWFRDGYGDKLRAKIPLNSHLVLHRRRGQGQRNDSELWLSSSDGTVVLQDNGEAASAGDVSDDEVRALLRSCLAGSRNCFDDTPEGHRFKF